MAGEIKRRSFSILLAVVAMGLITTVYLADHKITSPDLSPKPSTFDPDKDPSFYKVLLSGTLNDTAARATVYWNSSTQDLYLDANKLQPAGNGKQLELWAIQNGKFVPLGTFDPPLDELKQMKGISGASAFAVTIETAGGREVPTLETMQVIGSVVLKTRR